MINYKVVNLHNSKKEVFNMDLKEHKAYQKEFKAYSKEITATKDSTMKFLIRSGINTRTGRLTKTYSSPNSTRQKSK